MRSMLASFGRLPIRCPMSGFCQPLSGISYFDRVCGQLSRNFAKLCARGSDPQPPWLLSFAAFSRCQPCFPKHPLFRRVRLFAAKISRRISSAAGRDIAQHVVGPYGACSTRSVSSGDACHRGKPRARRNAYSSPTSKAASTSGVSRCALTFAALNRHYSPCGSIAAERGRRA